MATIGERCRELVREAPELRRRDQHYKLWVEYNVRYRGLPRDVGDALLRLRDSVKLANYESVRRASRKVLNEEGWAD